VCVLVVRAVCAAIDCATDVSLHRVVVTVRLPLDKVELVVPNLTRLHSDIVLFSLSHVVLVTVIVIVN